jgi:hypothetical protein
MLDDKERRRAERRLAEQDRDAFVRVGLDWVGIATGLVLCAVAFRKLGWSREIAAVLAGGFLAGVSLARVALAPEGRLLAKLYRERKEREARSA